MDNAELKAQLAAVLKECNDAAMAVAERALEAA